MVEAPIVEAPAPVVPSPKSDPRSSASSASSPSALAAELGALDAARSRLDAGDASGALSRLDDYTRSYPRGRLALEAEVLRIDALSRSGQRAVAEKRAATFLRRHPNSVLASRVRAYLND
jgi:outer membrane protein assembly factor BamD (BamD/ComL family)